MRTLFALVVGLLAIGCDASDISDNDPIGQVDPIDASDPDASSIDGAVFDAGDPADGSNRAEEFCARFDTLCGFDPNNNNRFDDQATCVGTFDGFNADRQDCVEGELDLFESDGIQVHCTRATGKNPCN
jgi:hypothetical protein